MQQGVLVRSGREGDSRRCSAIEAACAAMFADSPHPETAGDAPIPEAAFRDAAWTGRLLVGELDGEVAGFLIWEMERDSLHVCEIDVHPSRQRRGVARALIAALAGKALASDRDALTLTTWSDVSWNAPAYARLGFEILKPEDWTPECRADSRALAREGSDVSARVGMILWLEAPEEV